MTLKDIEFIIHCLPKGKTKFFYFKDKYAIDLLKYFIGDGKSVAEIKRSRYQALLQKPVIKSIIAMAAHGRTTIERVMQGEDGPQTVQEERWISPSNYKNVNKYYHEVLRPYHAIWDEAVLSAVIWFLRTEIGVTRIFYHTEESGRVLKQIWGRSPPQSIYNRLPRKFLFRETDLLPDLFSKKAIERIREKELRFFLLEI